MTCADLMNELQALGSEQYRKTYRRHGANPPLFGVSWAHLGKFKKKIKIDHALATQLWDSGNFDARILATMIADPAQLNGKTLDAWVKQVDCYPIADAFAKLVAATPLGVAKAEKWREAKDEWTSATGWSATGALAMNKDLDDAMFEQVLPIIESRIHGSRNRARHEMNAALIAIGVRSPKLQKASIAAARRIGKVEVDHGDTDCKTPDAIAYIQKVAARKKA